MDWIDSSWLMREATESTMPVRNRPSPSGFDMRFAHLFEADAPVPRIETAEASCTLKEAGKGLNPVDCNCLSEAHHGARGQASVIR